MDKAAFAEIFKARTKKLAVNTLKLFRRLKPSEESRIISRQLMRSSASVASNYRAACRARSRAEFYSKMSIVVEEADETVFWLEILEETELIAKEEIINLKQEITEILSVVARARKTASRQFNDRMSE